MLYKVEGRDRFTFGVLYEKDGKTEYDREYDPETAKSLAKERKGAVVNHQTGMVVLSYWSEVKIGDII